LLVECLSAIRESDRQHRLATSIEPSDNLLASGRGEGAPSLCERRNLYLERELACLKGLGAVILDDIG
jgi:hypothetical protein